jgi:hypothetical protein
MYHLIAVLSEVKYSKSKCLNAVFNAVTHSTYLKL